MVCSFFFTTSVECTIRRTTFIKYLTSGPLWFCWLVLLNVLLLLLYDQLFCATLFDSICLNFFTLISLFHLFAEFPIGSSSYLVRNIYKFYHSKTKYYSIQSIIF